jgi:DNA-binding MarR family transcriptional regulator
MANILFQLGENKLVSIKINPADRRQHYVSISSDGLLAIPYIETKVQQINDVAEADITEEKLNVFFEVVETIRQNLHKKNF